MALVPHTRKQIWRKSSLNKTKQTSWIYLLLISILSFPKPALIQGFLGEGWRFKEFKTNSLFQCLPERIGTLRKDSSQNVFFTGERSQRHWKVTIQWTVKKEKGSLGGKQIQIGSGFVLLLTSWQKSSRKNKMNIYQNVF